MIYKPGDFVRVPFYKTHDGQIAMVISIYEKSTHADGYVYNLLFEDGEIGTYWVSYIRPLEEKK